MSSYERDPAKRKVKPVESAQSLLDFDLGESSDDSDFRIEDHAAEETDDDSINSDDGPNKNQDDSSSSEDSELEQIKNSTNAGQDQSISQILEKTKKQDFKFPGNLADVLICAGCLGSRSDDSNEIVECDGCGVTVHEGCYGVSDVTSESSTISSASTEPWFCEACKAGVKDPDCELCPNKGGIFKETEVGAWVHLVCALYVPGVAFSEVERLSGVTLFEMAYSRWGLRACGACADSRYARTGVCIGCDAGLCKTFFHVTCGQREGLLAEAHSEEAEQADPFYAHCRMHSDKALVKKRKRNWLVLQLRTEKRKLELEKNVDEQSKLRIERKLLKYRRKYLAQKELRNPPWVPTQKMARMLYSSASAMRKFARKAECMGLDIHSLEFQDSQISALKEVSRRWHIPPAFSVEFVGYYLDRNSRVTSLRASLELLAADNGRLLKENDRLRALYDEAAKENTEAVDAMAAARLSLRKLYDAVLTLCPARQPPALLEDRPLLPPVVQRPTPKVTPAQLHNRLSVPTAAALKQGVGFPLSNRLDSQRGKVLSTSLEASSTCASAAASPGAGAVAGAGGICARACAVCARSSQRHLMACCDTCHHYYHLDCLTPPLQRLPKKSKLYGWQCSECDKTSDSEPEVMEKKVPRRPRARYSKDGAIIRDSMSPKSTPTSPTARKSAPTSAPTSPTARKLDVAKDRTPETKPMKIVHPASENVATLKVTIKPLDGYEDKRREAKKAKKLKQKSQEYGLNSGEDAKKSRKRSFTSPALTNTPLMSITPLVADSPAHSTSASASPIPTPHTHDASSSKLAHDTSFLSPHSSFSSFSSLMASDRERENKAMESSIETTIANLSSDIATYKANRKRRKEKHRSRYSPDLMRKPHKHKRKKKAYPEVENPHPHPRITIKIKTIPQADGTAAHQQVFYVPQPQPQPEPAALPTLVLSTDSLHPVIQALPPQQQRPDAAATELPPPKQLPPKPKPKPKSERVASREVRQARGGGAGARAPHGDLPPLDRCDVCLQPGDTANIVRCDECSKRYHFGCLEPPLTRNPKKRGYSWHCADCDPTDLESN